MANIKISELNEKTEVGLNDLFPIVDSTTSETKKITGANLLKNDYSTNEIRTNMKWIDGKPIYKKTIDTGDLSDYSRQTGENNIPVSHNITNIDKVVNIEAIGKIGIVSINMNGFRWSWYEQETSTEHYGTLIIKILPTMILLNGLESNIASSYIESSYVTLYYTKTTD